MDCFSPGEWAEVWPCIVREALPVLTHGQYVNILFTPRYISVSSKHVLSLNDDGHRVRFPITSAVEGTGSPAVSGGAVAKHPPRVTSNRRLQELTKDTLILQSVV